MGPSLRERLQSPRVALLANVALVMAGSTLALASFIDLITGVVIVVIGLVGMFVSLLGYRDDGDD
ncbi:MFS transporter [Natrarchaeobaculum sulfurireducens]|uniref:Major facilitator family transporter n=1 Tax=Natrarchaeobaculum sulfurireducens TaxID=2044521 RepID=A0A346PCG6_9EURY|nr:MFS transporter [Natrarchaeobaculum sulfurireducens]AXR77211.1 hypothetical protein AArc1_0870 [Natrarchaeobaculum sulfurireducens]AXR82824.1 hypothetical protein AArcMg_2834 [Natrarchaeobaculum sulfurireducens]